MIERPVGSGQWLFPECFDYILCHQSPQGDWPSYATVADKILNTTASLLALSRHKVRCNSKQKQDLEQRCGKARHALQEILSRWDVSSCDQVGFEILLSRHVALLAAEGVSVSFPSYSKLQALVNEKQQRMSSMREFIYRQPCTLLHSLEALVGVIDFDRIRRWREPNGSMMSSPSSTAAYLMNVSTWDDEAEGYLRTVLGRDDTVESGACAPSAWPTTVFEVSWVG